MMDQITMLLTKTLEANMYELLFQSFVAFDKAKLKIVKTQ